MIVPRIWLTDVFIIKHHLQQHFRVTCPQLELCAPNMYKTRPDVGSRQNDTKRMGGHSVSHTNDIIIPIDIYMELTYATRNCQDTVLWLYK